MYLKDRDRKTHDQKSKNVNITITWYTESSTANISKFPTTDYSFDSDEFWVDFFRELSHSQVGILK